VTDAGTRPTVLETFAVTGGTPSARRTGKVMSVPAPATTLMMPARMPAPKIAAIARKSMSFLQVCRHHVRLPYTVCNIAPRNHFCFFSMENPCETFDETGPRGQRSRSAPSHVVCGIAHTLQQRRRRRWHRRGLAGGRPRHPRSHRCQHLRRTHHLHLDVREAV